MVQASTPNPTSPWEFVSIDTGYTLPDVGSHDQALPYEKAGVVFVTRRYPRTSVKSGARHWVRREREGDREREVQIRAKYRYQASLDVNVGVSLLFLSPFGVSHWSHLLTPFLGSPLVSLRSLPWCLPWCLPWSLPLVSPLAFAPSLFISLSPWLIRGMGCKRFWPRHDLPHFDRLLGGINLHRIYGGVQWSGMVYSLTSSQT